MWKSLAIAALVVTLSPAAMAQSGGSSGNASGGVSAGQEGIGAPRRFERLPGTTERPRVAPGSSGQAGTTRQPRATPQSGPSAADETRRAGGTVDLNRNSATGMEPPASTGSGAMDRSRQLPLGPGTGARDTTVPDNSVYNPGLQR